ncbi:hypothetical protein JH06_0216 [Blastocystis sp. subtype 4]|uniref:hypothetical protein n=1 Tax=Blastocystis sp. subtype 4 TaxID=944170 RepID=UPI0007119B65|nr:hypothetical protein JH06_0216 [Blastocystis sp. subtype 4]KNB46439.1 hypothetical protein JH06_0216 [Blastocystis sp. subtype 4]|eukprot:XP_014529882.1 hypothetical protein JH06_0216 [Blastocystis sp. subtype 4]
MFFLVFLIVPLCVAQYNSNVAILARQKDFGNVNCGEFLSDCWDNHQVVTKIFGSIDGLPTDIDVAWYVYDDATCSTGAQVYAQFNGDITGDILYMSCYITMMQDTWLKQWTCQTPIEVSKEYDVTTLNCTDSKGANPFASYLEAVGYTETIDLYFTVHVVEDYLIHSSHQFKRLNYDGCIASPKVTGIITLMCRLFILRHVQAPI